MNKAPDLSPRRRAEEAAREGRLAQALRDNLKRRKEQVRARTGRAAGTGDASAALSNGPPSSKSKGHGGTTAD
jgi:hypothetical protein